jgi:hypothetical protein
MTTLSVTLKLRHYCQRRQERRVIRVWPDVPGWIVGDRGFASDAFRERLWNLGAPPAIPPRRTDPPLACPEWIHNNRHFVENLWARLKEWRAIATR